mgnify:CR=1 FL=1
MGAYMIIILPLTFIYGILIGSFLNVCIYRIPKHETIVTTPSHCMSCGYHLKWYDLVPLFSWLFLKGRCRKCKAKISAQYPIIEAANGFLWLGIIAWCGFTVEGVLYCLLSSVLLVMAMIDARTKEIPMGLIYFMTLLGIARIITDYKQWYLYVIGLFLVSGIFYIAFLVTKGRGIGFGDVHLMAACGMIIGAPKIFLAMMIGCLLGSIIHPLRMAISKTDHELAFGPYLAVGVMTAALFGQPVIDWYLSFF